MKQETYDEACRLKREIQSLKGDMNRLAEAITCSDSLRIVKELSERDSFYIGLSGQEKTDVLKNLLKIKEAKLIKAEQQFRNL